MTDDLAARLLAAIEEAEDDAKAAMDAPGVDQWMWDGYLYEGDGGGAWSGLDPLARNGQRIGAHVARQDPKATLIRCAADRKIVGRHVKVTEMWNEDDERGLFDVDLCETCAYGRSCDHCFSREDLPLVAWPCPTLRDLAADIYGLSTGVDDECE